MLVERWSEWTGDRMREAVRAGDMPEYAACINPVTGEEMGHNNPYHLETLLGHFAETVDEARKLADEFLDDPQDKILLVVAATWHDVGKMITMCPKERCLCDDCGKSHHKEAEVCRHCGGTSLTMREVLGFHGHAECGASDWVAGNIFNREQLDRGLARQARRLIEKHSKVGEKVKAFAYGKSADDLSEIETLDLLLTLADRLGRITPDFLDEEMSSSIGCIRDEVNGRRE